METFFEMLTYRRPHGSDTELRFIEKFLEPLGVEKDAMGNIIKRIGDSDTLWSSHTDTVHSVEGMQTLDITDNRVSLSKNSNSNCLGADCTTGVYIMTEMIKAKTPGLYVFHRGEECGAEGSRYIAGPGKALVKGIDKAIAFDRHSNVSVITHQFGRSCSDDFAKSVTEQIPYLKGDSTGLFTDTAHYTDIIRECTNLSVGYKHHHTSSEYQDLVYLAKFIPDIIALDHSKLRVSRAYDDQGFTWNHRPQYDRSNDSYASSGLSNFPWSDEDLEEEEVYLHNIKSVTMENLVRNNPVAAASLLLLYGVNQSEFVEHAFNSSRTNRER